MKKTIHIILSMLMLMSLCTMPTRAAKEQVNLIPKPDAPETYVYKPAYMSTGSSAKLDMVLKVDDFILNMMANDRQTLNSHSTYYIQYDIALDKNAYQATTDWDETGAPIFEDQGYGNIELTGEEYQAFNYFDLAKIEENAEAYSVLLSAVNRKMRPMIGNQNEIRYFFDFDNTNHSIKIRCRYVIKSVTRVGKEQLVEYTNGPWSDTAVIGKNATTGGLTRPESYEAPVVSDLTTHVGEDDVVRFKFNVDAPESILNAYLYYMAIGEGEVTGLEAEVSVNGRDWFISPLTDSASAVSALIDGEREFQYGINQSVIDQVTSYKMRVRYSGSEGTSPWSNILRYGPEVRVKNLRTQALDYKTIQLDWDAIENTKYYQIYRLNTQTEKWIKFKQSTTNSYTVEGVKTGVKYSYRVIANIEEGPDGYTYESKSSSTKSATAMLIGEPVLTIKANGNTKFDLSWTAVKGATRYLIYRKSTTAAWKKVLTLGGDEFNYTTSSMVPDTYTFMVKAARYDSVDRVQTNGSNTVSGTSVFTKPVITVQQEGSNTAKVSWEAVEGVKYYEVYRATKQDGTYSKLKTTTATSYETSKLTSGKTYYFKVRGYRSVDGTKVYTEDSDVKSYKAE